MRLLSQQHNSAGESNAAPFLSEIEDCTSEWTFPEESFDYVHARWLIGSIADWTALYKEAYKTLKPGGWLESHEPSAKITSEDESVTSDTALAQWEPIFIAGGEKLGRTFDLYRTQVQREALKEAGFVNIEEFSMKVGSESRSPSPVPRDWLTVGDPDPHRQLAQGSGSERAGNHSKVVLAK